MRLRTNRSGKITFPVTSPTCNLNSSAGSTGIAKVWLKCEEASLRRSLLGPFGVDNPSHGRTAYAVPIKDVHPTHCEGISVLHTSAASFCETRPERFE